MRKRGTECRVEEGQVLAHALAVLVTWPSAEQGSPRSWCQVMGTEQEDHYKS